MADMEEDMDFPDAVQLFRDYNRIYFGVRSHLLACLSNLI
jgi:hypothetical protein